MSRSETEAEAADALWQQDWYTPARRLASPNFEARPAGTSIDLIVIHSISLPPGMYGTHNVQQLFTNTLDWDAHPYFSAIRGLKVSAHFYITRRGEIWQFVSCDARAWHAGKSSYCGRDNCNDYSVGIEMEGLEGHTFEVYQYDALSELCQALGTRYPIKHIAGHEHVAPGRKFDPGPGFNWQALQDRLRSGNRCKFVFAAETAPSSG